MTSYVIVNEDKVRLFSGDYGETKAFAESFCASSLDAVLYQLRFLNKQSSGVVAYEYTHTGHRQVSPRRYIHKSSLKRLSAVPEAVYA